jgi:hypothetical protein
MDISGIQVNEIEDSKLFADFSDHFVHLQETYSKSNNSLNIKYNSK